MKNRQSTCIVFSTLLLLVLSGNSAAQTEAAEASPEAGQYALEEIMITATKRVESLQDVPVSVSAISGDQIKPGGITDVTDIALETPNFSMTTFNIGEPQYFIRGIGSTNDSAGSDPAVGNFIDDVYVGRTGGTATDLFDIDRVEVLRGPQGTLFGKNVVGGAISTTTRKPTEDFETRFGVTYGNYDLLMVQGMVNGAFSDTAFGRFSFSSENRDGYVDNVIDGKEYMDHDNISLRGKFLFLPHEDVEVLLGGDYSKDDLAGNCRNVNNLSLHNPLGLAAFYPPVIAATTGGDIRKCASSAEAFQEREVGGALFRVNWTAQDFTFTSISAYRQSNYKWSEDLAGMPLGTTPFNLVDQADESSDQFTQEFRLFSNGGERWDWLLGAFYMDENVDRSERFIGSFGAPIAAQGFVLLNGDVDFTQDLSSTTYAVYGKVDFHFGDSVDWSIGGRYAWDDKEIDQALINYENPAFDLFLLTLLHHPNPRVVLGIPANGPGNLIPYVGTGNPAFLRVPYQTTADENWGEFVPSTSLTWNYAEDAMVYATVSMGYKSGAFQAQTTTPEAAATPLDPEKATNYEIGIKNEFFDNRLRVNADIFYMDYTDLQVFRLVGSLLVGANADATTKGFELDVDTLLTEDWLFGVAYGYLNAEYDTFEATNFAGNSLPRAPENTWSAYTAYTFNMSNGSAVDLALNYTGQSSFFFEVSNQASSKEGSIGLFNGSISWRSADDRWNVSVWGRNLTDEEYRIHSITSNIAGTVDLWNLPRTYGVTAMVSF